MGSKRKLVAALVAASVVAPRGAAAAPIEPSSKWQVDFGDTQCIAARKFDTSLGDRLFAIRPSIDGQSYELMLTGPGVGPEFTKLLDGQVDLGGALQPASVLKSRTNERKTLYVYRITRDRAGGLWTTENVKLSAKGEINFELHTGSMAQLMPLMDECLAGLQKAWNMNGEQTGAVASAPMGDLRTLFSPDDYPAEAARVGKGGTVRYVLLVDEHGKVAGCNTTAPSGVMVLDAMGCQVILEKGKFAPARDKNGNPVKSVFVTPEIKWVLE